MKRLWMGSGLFLLSLAAAGEDHFAQRFALSLDGDAAYYAMEVPQAVYAASLRNDLGDLRVYNSTGELVPYSLDTPHMSVRQTLQRRTLPWFPLPPEDSGTTDMPLGVAIAPDGTLRATAGASLRASRHADLVDVGPVVGDAPVLLVHLANGSYQGRVSVDVSDDLRTWRALVQTQLLKVSNAGGTLEQERIDLEGLQERYVRLRWLDRAPQIASIEVQTRAGEPTVRDGAASRQWREGANVRAGGMPGEYLFETDGRYPVDRLDMNLPQPNTVVRATIHSRVSAQAPWREVGAGVLFRLHGKTGEERNPPLDVVPDTDHEWRVAVDVRNGGLGSGPLAVTVGWRPATLTFVARGAAPFTLAVGNSSVQPAAMARDELMVGTQSAVATARLGRALPELAMGAREVKPSNDAQARRRHVLWGALLLAVGTLGVLAWRLSRGAGGSGDDRVAR